VDTGEPIFVKAVKTLSITATYTGKPGTPTTVSAEMTHPTGWRRAVPMSASTMRRTATGATASAALDVDVLAGILKGFADETGLPAPGTALVLVAKVGSWSTRSELSFDGVQFRANPDLTATRSAAPSANDRTAPSGQMVNATGAYGGTSPVDRILESKSLAAAAVLGLLLLVAAGARAAHRSRHKAGLNVPTDRLVPISAHVPADGRTIVDVLSLDQLGRIAHQSTRPVFHMTTPDARIYLLDDGTVIYRLHEQTRVDAHVNPSACA
jgi:hypothetical protein